MIRKISIFDKPFFYYVDTLDSDSKTDGSETAFNLKDFCQNIEIHELPVESICKHQLDTFDPAHEACPNCGAKGMKRLPDYHRFLYILRNGEVVECFVLLPRVQCEKCGTSHVIFPSPLIIPFSSFSLLVILFFLKEFYSRKTSAAEFLREHNLSSSTLYDWIHRLQEDGEKLLQYVHELMKERKMSPSEQEPASSAQTDQDDTDTSAKKVQNGFDSSAQTDPSGKSFYIKAISALARGTVSLADAIDRFLVKTLRSLFQTHPNPSNCAAAPPGGLTLSPRLPAPSWLE